MWIRRVGREFTNQIAGRADSVDQGQRRAGVIDGCVLAIAQHKAMGRLVGIHVITDDVAVGVNPPGLRAGRARVVECSEV
jgi:hypothetical protein